eukprot:2540666-Rhodomonas_salina.1
MRQGSRFVLRRVGYETVQWSISHFTNCLSSLCHHDPLRSSPDPVPALPGLAPSSPLFNLSAWPFRPRCTAQLGTTCPRVAPLVQGCGEWYYFVLLGPGGESKRVETTRRSN